MRPADDIRRLFKNAELRIHPDGDEWVFEDVLKARQIVTGNLPATPDSAWRTIMRSPLTKLAAAALVVIACLIGLSLWRTTGSGIALADVLARMEQVKAYRFQLNTKVTGEDPNKPYSSEIRATWLRSQEYGSKSIWERLDPNGGESTFVEAYFLPQKKTAISITHKEKKYSRIEYDDRFAEQWPQTDPRTFLKEIVACKYESMGRSTVDGIEVEGFQTTDPNWLGNRKIKVEVDVKMWVDAKTRLPVRYDFTTAYFDQMGDKIIRRQHIVMHDFQWDVVVDAAEFEPPVIPDDYTGTVVKYPAHITEETAIQGLKILVELLGKYPENINDDAPTVLRLAEKSETPAAMLLKEEIKGLTEDEIGNKLVDFLMPIRGLGRFYGLLQYDKKGPAYYGKTVTPKDMDKVLMRWKVSDNEYRVIYGDLHAETVTLGKLAELEKLLPK